MSALNLPEQVDHYGSHNGYNANQVSKIFNYTVEITQQHYPGNLEVMKVSQDYQAVALNCTNPNCGAVHSCFPAQLLFAVGERILDAELSGYICSHCGSLRHMQNFMLVAWGRDEGEPHGRN